MPNLQKLVRASCKVLSTALGPLGFPAEFAISLYDDEQAEKRYSTLEREVQRGSTISEESLKEIFELKQGYEELRIQLIAGIRVVIDLLQDSGGFKALQQKSSGNATVDEMANVISGLIDSNNTATALLEQAGVMTEQCLVEELNDLYGDHLDSFLATVSAAGFPRGRIGNLTTPNVAYYYFVQECRGQTKEVLSKVFNALAREKPGSSVFNKAASLYSEIQAEKELRRTHEARQQGDSR